MKSKVQQLEKEEKEMKLALQHLKKGEKEMKLALTSCERRIQVIETRKFMYLYMHTQNIIRTFQAKLFLRYKTANLSFLLTFVII